MMNNNKNEEQQQQEMKNNNKMKNKNNNQHHKNLTSGSPKQSNITGSFCLPIKKMITEVLLKLPLYLILFFI